ncbi:Fic family protein [Neorhizobium sp. T7_12]|uniref:Fic family protein n=1 Tax=Neorhizobium sp. T7_12 TaxID=2093832 RepID=UPI000CF976EF|nr:Fic family protein [Neorhizobium sp. T7_12]
MSDSVADKNPDISAAADRDESTGLMEPMLVSDGSKHKSALADLALTLAEESAAFRSSLPAGVMHALADLVRAMNCYYSNLIEGHNTHPVDIERALKDDYSANPEKRNLQLEARAHITVQAWIDGGTIKGVATNADTLREIHRRFCELLPGEMLFAEDPKTAEKIPVVPGEVRQRDVKVGRHIPVSPGAVPRFLARFEEAYRRLGRIDSVLAAAAAHHRFAWIHPFLDGNGRVGRLMTHAMLLDTLDTGGVWSVSRGLARSEKAYKDHLAACDMTRRNDLDGRGTLSEEALATFTRYFLETCIDQVRFMRDLVEPGKLRDRILRWVEEEVRADKLPAKSGNVLEAVLYRGALPRGDVPDLLGLTDRQARRITSALLDAGILTSQSSKAPLHLAFPAALAQFWMPGLFPAKDD